MASELKVDKFTGVTTAGSIDVTGEGNSTTTNLQQGLCKHWVNFEGDGTVAVSDSFNNASITDNATGKYTLANTNNFNNATYGFSGGGTHDVGSYNVYLIIDHDTNGGLATSSTNLNSTSPASSGTSTDAELLSFSNHGDLA